jgi:nucleoside-diphosphate-sugar epimerase
VGNTTPVEAVVRRVAVTGATGFVGRAVVRRLASEGVEVVALTRNDAGPLEGAAATLAVGDLRAPTRLADALEGCDAVVHLAAWVHRMGVDGDEALAEARAVNVDGTRNVAEAAIAAGARRVVYMSSIKVMGEERERPFRDADIEHPAGAYAATKLEAERLLMAHQSSGALDVTVLRPPLVHGPGVRANFLSLLRFVARWGFWPFGAQTNRRSIIYVENLADAVAAALRAPATVGKAYLVDDGEALSTAELLRRLAKALDRRLVELPLGGQFARRAARLAGRDESARRIFGSMFVDSSNFRRDAEWSPRFSTDEGLRATATWFNSMQP